VPGFTVTRGLGGSPSSLIARGFVDTARAIVKGGRRFAEKAVADIGESLKISVMLINANGKELSKPIISNVTKVYKASSDIFIRVMPKTLIQRKARNIKVTAQLRDKK
tara:strand:+ start:421 stop:744 length:324 start_codon:yes stop_codon:yes gene_type:complete